MASNKTAVREQALTLNLVHTLTHIYLVLALSFSTWISLWSLSFCLLCFSSWTQRMIFGSEKHKLSLKYPQRAQKWTPVSLPVPFELTHIGHYWWPVEGPWLLLQPLLQLLKVLVTVVSSNDLLEGFTSRKELIDGGTRADVNQEITPHTIWFRGRNGEGESGIVWWQIELICTVFARTVMGAPRRALRTDHPLVLMDHRYSLFFCQSLLLKQLPIF